VPEDDLPDSVQSQTENEAAYRQLLVQGVLAVLLPTEDLENECLTALVGQIFSELIIGNAIANRIAEPWMIWEILIILSRVIRQRTHGVASDPASVVTPLESSPPTAARKGFSLQWIFWSFMQWCFFASSAVRLLVTLVISSRSVSSRIRHKTSHSEDMTGRNGTVLDAHPTSAKVPVVSFRIWTAVSNLIELDSRMPWLSGAISMVQWTAMTGPGRIADVDGPLDR
jgi:hypothetical protein